MAYLNKTMLIGYMVKDPEIKYTPSGTAILDFTIATNKKYKDKEEVFFAPIKAFGKAAETIATYVAKGDPIYIEGRLKRESWDDKNGKKREKVLIILESFQLLGSKKDSGSNKQSTDDEEIF